MLNARSQLRHFTHSILALHGGGVVATILAAGLVAQVEPQPWRQGALIAITLLVLEAMFFLPILGRFRAILGELIESEARKRGILEAALDPVFITDRAGRILDFNPAAEKVFDYRSEQAQGKLLSQLLLPAPWSVSYEAAIHEFLETGDNRVLTRRSEVQARRSSGHAFSAELTITPVHAGDEVFFNVCIRDITDRKQVERWLIEAREAAVAASRVKSEFLANMSHEIRTPLNTVIGMTSLLRTTALTNEQTEYASAARGAADILLTLLNEILDLSKIESGKMELETIDFDLPLVVRETVAMVQHPATQKNLALSVDVSPEVPGYLRGDPGRLRQVLLNLLTNAVKFTENGGITLFVGTVEPIEPVSDRCAARLHFEVADTGIGVSETAKNRLFQSFSQADSSTTRKYGGTGLGLSISKKLVELMRGKIGFSSLAGQGSKFWFDLPFAEAKKPNPAFDLPIANHSANSAAVARTNRHRILVVEDNAVNSKMTIRMLETLGITADPAGNGFEALASIKKIQYDLVLMDCQMPEMDGYQATAAVRASEGLGGRRLPVIALSGNVMQADRLEAKASGMDDFLPKPIVLEDLAAMVDRWLPIQKDRPLDKELVQQQQENGPALDLKVVAGLRTLEIPGTPSFLRELVDTFNGSITERFNKMKKAIAEGDSAALTKVAHTLKSAAASLGAVTLGGSCAELEAVAKKGDVADAEIGRLMARIDGQYRRAREAWAVEVAANRECITVKRLTG